MATPVDARGSSSGSPAPDKADDVVNVSEVPAASPAVALKSEDIGRTPNPLLHANCISRLLFYWPYPLLRLGMQRPLEEGDLPEIPSADTSAVNLSMMEDMWRNEQQRVQQTKRTDEKKRKPSLHRAIVRDFLTSVWYVQPLMFASSAARLMQAVALGLLLETFEPSDAGANPNPNEGYIWASVLVLCGAIILMEHHHVFWITWRKGMQYRTACVAAIYSKALRLKSTAGTEAASSGRVLNLASNDVERFILATLFVSYLFWAPVQSLAILGLGIRLIGPAFAAGMGLLIGVFVPLQFYLSKKFATLRSKVAAITDQRVTLVSQAVGGVRVMKMAGWENQFNQRIADVRRREIRQIQKANRLKAMNESLFFAANVVISITTFLVHVATGGVLSPRVVYTTLTLINILQIELTKHLSLAVMGVSECWVSISRIQKFFEYPELNVSKNGTAKTAPDVIIEDLDEENDTAPPLALISISGGTCYWNGNGTKATADQESNHSASLVPALRQINLELHRSELTCVIGVVGSGKSALLQMLAGELEVTSGRVDRRYSTKSYVSQDPWIMDGTVKENILMGKAFEQVWYQKVVEACCLVADFEQLRNGDLTIVGDRGVQLSGGQRARIGLARALYRDPDVLLLDDPLSAVDSRVGRVIFYDAVLGLALKRGKCVVLATHQHQYLHDQRCVLVAEGRIDCVGAYSDCVDASKGTLRKSMYSAEDSSGPAKNRERPSSVVKEATGSSTGNSKSDAADHEEVKIQGVVKRQTFIKYAKAMGGIMVGAFLIVLFSVTQASVL